MTHNENYQTTLLTNPPPADYSSSTSVNENRAEPDNMVTSLEVNSSIEASKDNSSEALNEEEVEDPLNEHRSPASETCLQSVIPDYPILTEEQNSSNSSGTEVYNIAPGENKHPVSLMNDKLCEELAFPVLFPKGRFGYAAERQIKITPVKYFNARLLHHSGRFASNPEYLFFAQFIIEQKKVSDNINIALKNVHGQNVTASQVRTNTQILQNLISQDQAYLFLRQIPGSPPYWQKFMYEVVAMVKQLGIPTWFMTLSCADLRWPELFQIIARTNGKNITTEEVEALSYDEKCRLLNLNPVIVAKHFQYRVETFFTETLLTNANPIGKIIYSFSVHSVQKIEKYLKCKHCNKKILQGTCTDVIQCERCGFIMRATICEKSVTAKIVVLLDEQQVSLKIDDTLLTKMFGDVISIDDKTLAQKLLFLEDFAVTYNTDTLVVSDINM